MAGGSGSCGTASSIICFKNGYSFVSVPVQLVPGEEECQVGPIPSFAVHGTVGLVPNDARNVRIFSLEQAKRRQRLAMPAGPDHSFAGFLAANVGTAVRLTVLWDRTQEKVTAVLA